MKILICSREYSPDITPVAFRAEALTQEFLRRGYQVDLFIPGNKVVTAQPGNLRMVTVGGDVYAPWVYWREKRALKIFDYVTVRLEAVIPAFAHYKERDKIKVVSQGYDFGQISLPEYHKNPVPTFAFAGRFYRHIRNPYQFFEYLRNLSGAFKFYLYLDKDSQKMVEPYLQDIKDKVQVHDFVPREVLLPKLAKMDFLLNFVNAGRPHQLPSKIIDYAFTGRPILNISCEQFKAETFKNFLQGRYEEALQVNWQQHDIRVIADKFLALVPKT